MDSSSSSSQLRRQHRRAVSTPAKTVQYTHIAPTLSSHHVSPSSPESTRTPRTTSSFMTTVKRTFVPSSTKRRQNDDISHQRLRFGMYSTPEERMSPHNLQLQAFQAPNHLTASPAPPSIEQIAMGLHISRTPHLVRPLGSSRNPYSQRNHSAPAHSHRGQMSPIVLPPPPARSSMKKGTATVSSNSSQLKLSTPVPPASSPTPTMTSGSAAASSARSSFIIHSGGLLSKLRMGRLFSVSRASSAPSSSLISTPVSSPRQSTSDLDIIQRKAVRFQSAEEDGRD